MGHTLEGDEPLHRRGAPEGARLPPDLDPLRRKLSCHQLCEVSAVESFALNPGLAYNLPVRDLPEPPRLQILIQDQLARAQFIKYRALDIMVPLSEKRHRLYSHEIPEVIQGLLLRLETLEKERKAEEKAKVAFRTLYRLMFAEKGGRPKYPEFSWSEAQVFVEMYKDET